MDLQPDGQNECRREEKYQPEEIQFSEGVEPLGQSQGAQYPFPKLQKKQGARPAGKADGKAEPKTPK
jgi:hypothetical protein